MESVLGNFHIFVDMSIVFLCQFYVIFEFQATDRHSPVPTIFVSIFSRRVSQHIQVEEVSTVMSQRAMNTSPPASVIIQTKPGVGEVSHG